MLSAKPTRQRMMLCLVLTVCAAGARSEHADFVVSEVADGIFVHQGAHAEASADNHNDIANIGFVVGNDCVAVIDSGGSPTAGEQLRAAIKRHTDLPVCFVINTHVHPDHLLGNAAFVAQGPEFVGHQNLEQALATRAQTYIERLGDILGVEATQDWVVPPNRAVSGTTTLDLGGRQLQLQAWPTAHTNNDLTIFDPTTGTLFTGDLVFMTRVPALDGSINGWLTVLDELSAREKVKQIIPGHGPPSAPWPDAAQPLRRYLMAVREGVRQAIDDGRTIEYAIDNVGYEQRPKWKLFKHYHRRNVTAAFAELEWE